jgi:hypothetical protein
MVACYYDAMLLKAIGYTKVLLRDLN